MFKTKSKKRVLFREGSHVVRPRSDSPLPTKRLVLKENGDVLLVLTEKSGGLERKEEILCSSEALAMASPVFASMVEAHLVRRGQAGGVIVIELPRTDALSMRVLCRLAHGIVYKEAKTGQLHNVGKIASTAHRYGCEHLLAPRAAVWITGKHVLRATRRGRKQTITIAFMLGNSIIFEEVTRQIVLQSAGPLHEVYGKDFGYGFRLPRRVLGGSLTPYPHSAN